MEQLLPAEPTGVVDTALFDDVFWILNSNNGSLRRFHVGKGTRLLRRR